MLVHPGTFFAIIWLVSVYSQDLLMTFDLAQIRDIASINELNIFVIFTSSFFSFWVMVYDDKSKRKFNSNFRLNINLNLFKQFLMITLIGSFLLMLYTWYSIGVNSLSLAHIRDLNTQDKSNYFGTDSNIIISILKYTQFFFPILAIVSGYFLGRIYLIGEKLNISNRILYIPIVISLIYVFTNGGRNPLFIGIKLYFVGICFSLPYKFTAERKKWLLNRIILLSIVLTIFSTIVSDSRSEYYKISTFSQNFENPILSNASGIVEYLGAHYYGYQLRNLDSYHENELGLGFFTFYSLFDISVPFSNYLGIKSNLGSLLGYKENRIDYFYLWRNEMEGYFTTNSMFLGLKLDFGFYGALFFLLVFTLYTHRLFIRIQNQNAITVYTFFWFYLCFEFWASSNFKSSYSSGLVAGLIMILLFSRFFIIKQRYRANF